MKSYGIFPLIKLHEEDECSRACINIVSDIIVGALTQGGDSFHYVVDWLNPGEKLEAGFFNSLIARPHVMQLANRDELLMRVRKAVDPFDASSATIRSIATCRVVTFGYDGQAFLCMRHEDEPPKSADTALVVVEERTDLMIETDYFDGWVPGAEAPANDR